MIKLSTQDDGVRVPVYVQAGASRDRLCGEHDGRLKLSVSAPPEKGKANRAVCRFLAAELGVPGSHVRLVSGHASRLKEVFIELEGLKINIEPEEKLPSLEELKETVLQCERKMRHLEPINMKAIDDYDEQHIGPINPF